MQAIEEDDTLARHFPPPRYRAVRDTADDAAHRFADTMPVEPVAAHAASEIDDDDRMRPGEGAGIVLWPVLIVSVVVSAAGLWHIVAWLFK